MEIKSLENTPLSEIVKAFNAAFANYFVPVAASEAAMQKRWHSARVDYHLSFGAFHEGRLASFIMTGIDHLNGLKTAYNAGTGVIPEFRGQKLVERLYQKAIPEFKAQGVQQCTLEVITRNNPAIRAYQKVGFQVTRTLHCFMGNLISNPENGGLSEFQATRTRNFNLRQYRPFQTYDYSWDYGNQGVNRQDKELEAWHLYQNQNLVGYLLLNPANGLIFQLGFQPDIMPKGSKVLLQTLAKETPAVRINNVDSRAVEIALALKEAGLENHLDQYEMLLKLA